MNVKTRIKFGYLTYDDMIAKLSGDNPELDAYDIVFGKDSRECFFITPELQPMPVLSRVLPFNSVSEAIVQLNSSPTTYEGQLVAIKYNDAYRGYIVNKKDDMFYVTSTNSYEDGELDYNTLGNKPIVNVTGTLEMPVIISVLIDGIYKISGAYKFIPKEETNYFANLDTIFYVSHEDDGVYIKKVTVKNVTDYKVVNANVQSDDYITESMLNAKGYATTEYVDNKIQDTTEDVVERVLDEQIDEKVLASIEQMEIPQEQVEALFKQD